MRWSRAQWATALLVCAAASALAGTVSVIEGRYYLAGVAGLLVLGELVIAWMLRRRRSRPGTT
ncbi:MAG: hypothetical protein KJZ87_09165 [Thermoguttaceae bacterium]|nr:hypothetical protein [Thermoguttaceae bacterium]